MSDENPEGTSPETTPGPDLRAAHDRLKAEREALKSQLSELSAWKAEQEAAAAAREREEAEAREEYKSLYDKTSGELEEYKQKYKELTAREQARMDRLKERNAERIAELPEAQRDLVPDLDPEAQAAWLDKAAKLLQPTDTRPRGGRAGGGHTPDPDAIPEVIRAEVEAEAVRHKQEPKRWYKINQRRWDRRAKKLSNP
jgi:chromosome segregation ATPase